MGRKEARFCIKTTHPELIDLLREFEGQNILEIYNQIAPKMIPYSPVRVVETALGRLEIASKIPMPDEKTTPGSHTHFLPDHIMTERTMPAGMEIPNHYLAGAIFYPHPEET
ncbi:MAG: hypothetical protein HWE30_16435 [Methylocystaceae bacterium]|nr:hypothetical protein [Methylocystaceae bacterium]